MVAYNFQTRFAEDVAQGRKRQTIRAMGRRRHARPGEMIQLYTGMRTKSCRKLREDVECRAVRQVVIDGARPFVALDGRFLRPEALASFAEADGFRTVTEMLIFFRDTHGLPFHGVLIQWK